MESFEREVQNRFKVVKDLYGERLDAHQLAEVRKGIEAIVRQADALGAVKLPNGDEPSWVFAPYRHDG